MKKVLAITVALMIAAIVIMPALGYTNQAAGITAFTAKSGDKVDYSFTTEVPAHNLTSDMVANKYSFTSTGIVSTKIPYSFKQGAATLYSFKLLGVENAVAQGMKTKKPVAKLGSMNTAEPAAEPLAKTEDAVKAEPMAEPVTEPAAEPAAEPKFSIEGMVVDNNNTGLAGWTINLTTGGAVLNSVPTAADGKFAFADLAAGEYTVSEALMEGWNIVSPAEGMFAVTITDASKTDLVFVNQPAPVVVEPEAIVPAASENATAPANDTVLGNDTAAVNAPV